MKKILAAITMTAFWTASIMAVDLKNEDSNSYDVVIEDGGSTNSSIGGNTTQLSICSSCKIIVKGVGEVSVSGSSTVLIKDGKISVQ